MGSEACVSEIMRNRVLTCVVEVGGVGAEDMVVVMLELWSLGGSSTVQVGLAGDHRNHSFLLTTTCLVCEKQL